MAKQFSELLPFAVEIERVHSMLQEIEDQFLLVEFFPGGFIEIGRLCIKLQVFYFCDGLLRLQGRQCSAEDLSIVFQKSFAEGADGLTLFVQTKFCKYIVYLQHAVMQTRSYIEVRIH